MIQHIGENSALIRRFLKESEEHFLDHHGIIFMSSSPESRVTGFALKELMLKSFSFLYEPQGNHPLAAQDDLAKACATGQATEIRWFKRRGGGIFLAKISIRKLKAHDFADQYSLRIYDYTPEYLAETRSQQTQQRLTQLVNSSCSGTFQFRVRDGMILSAGSFVISLLPSQSLPGRLSDLLGSSTEWLALKKRIVTKLKSVDAEFCINGNSSRLALLKCTPTVTSGVIDGLILEITSAKSDANELENIHTDLQALVYQTSHGFRAPLASALGLLGLIRMECDGLHEKKYLNLIEQQITKMDTRLKNLAAVAMIHQAPLMVQPFDFSGEVNNLVENLKREFPGVTITIGYLPEQEFASDVSRLRVILQHLLHNACHFKKHEQEHWVAFTASLDSVTLDIEIYDNGIGIPKESMDNLFQMFYRGSPTSDGTGLGLYTVKRMVEKMHGTIRIDSVEGIGTTVRIRIPVEINDQIPNSP
ncbi:MAG TPA: HAMP domain-containing sensor histidine kinase [Cyclobacteriaceae bacterium]|nr:HAMP domain-containing histidine kinase [Cyclobacteriaceae bacterium]HMV07262.1 HAMP domain-containing sensor histidine kinase [Cyclobacteriaceae bacterium]HMV88577.1 HAMP domain-containing sensor histidine kinase [Cyclobacteriaceae bacterium]HMW99383.1 HAMP domain-containing sensor histidine kinase [Cyclobacteriaceae bacterium]HMX48828.1 HAMP domain-containing sensor histidine kinase [Cyclobacteriaceae bacterium]